MKFHKLLLAFLLIAVIGGSYSEAFAVSTISTVTRLNLSKGRVNGEKVDYIIYLPTLWASSLTAEREKVNDKDAVIEKIVFYYVPQEKTAKPVYFMTFYLYDKRKMKDTDKATKLLESNDYIFAIDNGSQIVIENKTDSAIFDRLHTELKDTEYISNFFRLPGNQKVIISNAITVNGNKLKGKSANFDGVLYVPVRDICEELGYKVTWLDKERAVSIARNNFYYILFLDPAVFQNYKVNITDGKAYVPTIFLIQKLNTNIEVDENYCVFINS